MEAESETRFVTTDGEHVAQYCSPKDVMEALRYIDYDSPFVTNDVLDPSDASIPNYDQLIFRICAKEDEIDYYTGQSWRCNRVVDDIQTINTYWHDQNSVRAEYWAQGGYYVQLNQDVREWDPLKGDRIRFRTLNNAWLDLSEAVEQSTEEACDGGAFWFDYPMGKLYLRTRIFSPKYNAIKITYRYGKTQPVPPSIRRCCALMVGLTVMNEEIYMTRLGQGGELGGQKNDMKKAMQEEINSILMMHRVITPVRSLLG